MNTSNEVKTVNLSPVAGSMEPVTGPEPSISEGRAFGGFDLQVRLLCLLK